MYHHSKSYFYFAGFSLIELMVAMLIGLLVLAGVIQVVLNSKRSFIDNQETAFIQENTRYALDIIAKDIRSSGYRGCARQEPTVVNVIRFQEKASAGEGVGTLADAFAFGMAPFTGEDTKTKDDLFEPEVGGILPDDVLPDTLTLRTLANENENVIRIHNPRSSTLTTAANLRLNDGTPLMIIDAKCENIAIVAAGTGGEDANQLQLTPNLNCSNGLTSAMDASCTAGSINLTKPITPGSSVFPYLVNTYFIGKSSLTINQNMPALKRQYLTSVGGRPAFRVEEIAQGVEDMQITYGINDGNGNVTNDDFVSADLVGNWDQVVAVNVQLTLRSNLPVNTPVNGDDGYIRKRVATTISLRNFGG